MGIKFDKTNSPMSKLKLDLHIRYNNSLAIDEAQGVILH
jgi:hypothetical protein